MILINKGTETTIYPTFTELMIDPYNWILIRLESEMLKDNDLQYFLLKVNTSLQIGRFDTYIVTETSESADLDPEAAIISIPLTGFYKYTAFEYDKTLPFDPINPESVKQVETGRIRVDGDDDNEALNDVYK
tara:strand:- start:109 stop:504 length:396 start_codon:yes stop_codon:yes gene_type:complete